MDVRVVDYPLAAATVGEDARKRPCKSERN
jgi:hypothetical protein